MFLKQARTTSYGLSHRKLFEMSGDRRLGDGTEALLAQDWRVKFNSGQWIL